MCASAEQCPLRPESDHSRRESEMARWANSFYPAIRGHLIFLPYFTVQESGQPESQQSCAGNRSGKRCVWQRGR